MDGNNMCASGFRSVHKMRFMENLLKQVKADYGQLNQLWDKLKKGRVDKQKIDEIHGIISYLKKDLKMLYELERRGIEGILWGEIETIENDVLNKEINLKIMSIRIN